MEGTPKLPETARDADTVRMDERVQRLIEAAREMLQPIDHEGPCINYDGQDPEGYDPWDSCSRHLTAAAGRKARLAEALRQFDGFEEA